MKNKKIPILLVLSSLTLLLTSCDGTPFNSEDFMSRISFNVWDFLVTFVAFLVLLLIAFFFGYKPVKKYIKKRGDYVEGKIKTAEKREEDSRGLVEEANKQVAESKKEAVTIVEKARDDANKQREAILEQAKADADATFEKAQRDIEQEISKSKDEIHREIVSVAMEASKKVLEREINEDDNSRLIDDFVKDLDK